MDGFVMSDKSKIEWAEKFKAFPKCQRCPFVIASVDMGDVVCDHICMKSVPEIVEAMEEYERAGDER
jgi:hypothetical protein